MSIHVPQLDDRRFQDIVDEAKRSIPRHFKEWTNHNVSDPGVALIELFAWMTEMTLYRLNQVPDKLYTELLNLVGIAPFPAQAAQADLTFWLSSSDVPGVVVPAATEVATTTGVDGAVVFATDDDLLIRQPMLKAVLSKAATGPYVDRLDDMEHPGTVVPCFSDVPEPGDEMLIGFESSLSRAALELTIGCTSEGLGIDPANPPLEWETWTGDAWASARVHIDETGGLNRDGRVVLLLDEKHEELRLGSEGSVTAHWLRLRLRKPYRGERFYEASPRVRSLAVATIGGTVSSHHGEPYGRHTLGLSNGEPGQSFVLPNTPNLKPNEREFLTVGGDRWELVETFASAGMDAKVFTWDLNDGVITFGPLVTLPDGSAVQKGAVPPEAAEIVISGYRVGGGKRGNVAPHAIRSLRTTIANIASVENLRRSRGGVDAETVDNAKTRGPLALRSGGRAVTVSDYEYLARDAAPELAHVWCRPPDSPGDPVRLLLVPKVSVDPQFQELNDYALSRELYEKVKREIDPRRIVGTVCKITTPFYQGVSVVVRVAPEPLADAVDVGGRVRGRLYEYINPVSGGPHGRGLPFDEPLTADTIHELVIGIPGVANVEEVALYLADLRPRGRLDRPRTIVHPEPDSLFLSVQHRVVVA